MIENMSGQFSWFWSVIVPLSVFAVSVIASFWLYWHFNKKQK